MSRGKSPFMRRYRRGQSTRGHVVKLYVWKGPLAHRIAAVSAKEQGAR